MAPKVLALETTDMLYWELHRFKIYIYELLPTLKKTNQEILQNNLQKNMAFGFPALALLCLFSN